MRNESFSRNLRALRQARGLTQAELAELLGVTQTTVCNWEGGLLPRSGQVLESLLDALEATDADLFGYSDGYAARSEATPAGVLQPAAPKPAAAPLLATVHAGNADVSAEQAERVPVPYEVMQKHAGGYFLEVIGDCMNNTLPVGCLVLIDPDAQPVNGSIALVRIGDGYVLRRWYKGANSVLLSPDSTNPIHEDILITDQTPDAQYCGLCVWYQARNLLA